LWQHEPRRADRTLADQRGGYRTEQEAKNASERAKLWFKEARHPYEMLTVITKPE